MYCRYYNNKNCNFSKTNCAGFSAESCPFYLVRILKYLDYLGSDSVLIAEPIDTAFIFGVEPTLENIPVYKLGNAKYIAVGAKYANLGQHLLCSFCWGSELAVPFDLRGNWYINGQAAPFFCSKKLDCVVAKYGLAIENMPILNCEELDLNYLKQNYKEVIANV